jgi:hypothetical protein
MPPSMMLKPAFVNTARAGSLRRNFKNDAVFALAFVVAATG